MALTVSLCDKIEVANEWHICSVEAMLQRNQMDAEEKRPIECDFRLG